MTRLLLAGLAGSLLLASPGFAQSVPGAPSGIGGAHATRDRKAPEPAPAGVPGARAEPALVAPAERVPTDMPPTEALFDAVNRGDITAAKEAIGRGADIHGRNVLGLTPLELSVDLGRSNISFLLLSLRAGEGYNTSGPPRQAAATPATPADRRAARRAELEAQRQQQAADRQSARAGQAQATAAAQPRAARLFAGDGGAPVPQAGFLGFDAAR